MITPFDSLFHLSIPPLASFRLSDNGARGSSTGFLAKHVWNEGEGCTGWEGYQVWVQGGGLEEQEPSTSEDEPHSQEDTSSHPQRQTSMWVSGHRSVHWRGVERQESIFALWSLPQSLFQILGWFYWAEGPFTLPIVEAICNFFLSFFCSVLCSFPFFFTEKKFPTNVILYIYIYIF